MAQYGWLLAVFFLPLFPFSMVFNALFQRVTDRYYRALLVLIWPLTGVWLVWQSQAEPPEWLRYWALFTALLYTFRLLVVNDMSIWAGFVVSSAWALIWVLAPAGATLEYLVAVELALSVPVLLLVWVIADIRQRYQSVHAGVVSGLARAQPRLAGVFAVSLLAVIASPVFPGFFVLLGGIAAVVDAMPMMALGLSAVWLLWSWAGMRLLQNMLVGSRQPDVSQDIGALATIAYSLFMLLLLAGGVYLPGVMA